MDRSEIKQIDYFLSGVYDGICEGDEAITMQIQLEKLYRIIERLMKATFKTKDRDKKIVLALLEKRARKYKAEIESRLAVRNLNLTMSRYTHTLRGQTAKAIESLPDLSLPSKKAQKAVATGTENICLDTCLDTSSIKNCNKPEPTRKTKAVGASSEMAVDMSKTVILGSLSKLPKVGIEPTPCCQDGILNPARLPIPPLRLF